jgi:peptidoglycan hydrolase-like protein with peptidoglycan-binding domain
MRADGTRFSIRPRRRRLIGALFGGTLLLTTPLPIPLSSPSAATASFPSELAIGSRGTHVAALQRALIAAGVAVPGGADGIFGNATAGAVRTFQTRRGLPVTGVADRATLRALGLVAETTPAPTAAETTTGATRGGSGTPNSEVTALRIGDRGPQVAALQRALIAAGLTVRGGADGIYGNATAEAVRAYQTRQKLPVSGTADAQTLIALGLVEPTRPAPAPAPATTTPNVAATLKIGDRGDAVARLQQALITAGIPVAGGADGVFGLATQAAVRSYQTRQGLSATGIADQQTLVALGIAAGPSAPAAPVSGPGTPATAPPTAGSLSIGARGDDVKAVQEALIRAGIHVAGGADGVFGAATQAAVRSFQASRGLPATGVVDEATRRALGIGGASSTPTNDNTVLLKVGDRGPDVVRVQQALIDRGVPVRGGADGIYGLATSGAVREFQLNRGLVQTGNVDRATWNALGLDDNAAQSAPRATIDVFPMQGPCYFGDTWGAPRSGGRRHEGVDIIGASGRLIYAVVTGTITRKYIDTPGSLAGNGVRLTAPDGTYYFYAHFSGFADGIEIGTVVQAGQVIGFNGATGNAAVPHLHFEIHPGGGAAINPFPIVKAIDGCRRTEPLPQPAAAS